MLYSQLFEMPLIFWIAAAVVSAVFVPIIGHYFGGLTDLWQDGKHRVFGIVLAVCGTCFTFAYLVFGRWNLGWSRQHSWIYGLLILVYMGIGGYLTTLHTVGRRRKSS